MERSTAIQHEQKAPLSQDPWPHWFDADPRWSLAQRVVAGSHFARSPLLSKFLLHVVAETLEGRESEITEHKIGVQVFDRPSDYRTIEDNIVRNYARQLRKRLVEHFAGEGSSEDLRIDIPPPLLAVLPMKMQLETLGLPLSIYIPPPRPGFPSPVPPVTVKPSNSEVELAPLPVTTV